MYIHFQILADYIFAQQYLRTSVSAKYIRRQQHASVLKKRNVEKKAPALTKTKQYFSAIKPGNCPLLLPLILYIYIHVVLEAIWIIWHYLSRNNYSVFFVHHEINVNSKTLDMFTERHASHGNAY